MSEAQATHPYAMDEAVAYLDGELPAAARAAFEAHLATCAECQGRLDAATVSLGAFDELLAEQAPPVDVAEVQASMRRVEVQLRAARKRRRAVWTLVGVGLAAAAALLVSLLVQGQAPRAPEPRQQIAPREQPRPQKVEAAPLP